MKVILGFEKFVKNLSDISEVVDDSLTSDDLKNVIFCVEGEKLKLLGYNRWVTFIRYIDDSDVRILDNDSENEPVMFQVASKELSSFLNAYKGVRQTEVEEVILELKNNNKMVLCTVVERNLDTDERLTSSWTFAVLPIKPNVLKAIDKPIPEESSLETLETMNILFYTNNLVPLLLPGTNLYSQISFGDDKVVVFCQSHVAFMGNSLTDTFKGVKFMHKSISFMEKVLCSYDTVSVAKTPTDIFFKTEDSIAFIAYDNHLPEYKMYLDMFKTDSSIEIDRIYFKDVLRRLHLLHDNIEVVIDTENGVLHLSNSKFEQEVGILNSNGMEKIEKRKFKIMPEVLSKAIIGSDEVFSPTLTLYFSPQPNKSTVLTFADDTRSWFTAVTIKPY